MHTHTHVCVCASFRMQFLHTHSCVCLCVRACCTYAMISSRDVCGSYLVVPNCINCRFWYNTSLSGGWKCLSGGWADHHQPVCAHPCNRQIAINLLMHSSLLLQKSKVGSHFYHYQRLVYSGHVLVAWELCAKQSVSFSVGFGIPLCDVRHIILTLSLHLNVVKMEYSTCNSSSTGSWPFYYYWCMSEIEISQLILKSHSLYAALMIMAKGHELVEHNYIISVSDTLYIYNTHVGGNKCLMCAWGWCNIITSAVHNLDRCMIWVQC